VVSVLLAALSAAAMAAPEGPKLGRPATHEEIRAADINVFPDGSGLPPGKGTAVEGKVLYDAQCASCHGPKGTGGSAGELAGGLSLTGPHPDKTIGTYWPYATTIFDFVRRSMPLNAPRSLSDDQQAEMYAKSLPEVKMPNRDGFVKIWESENRR
jgi:cytochrome c